MLCCCMLHVHSRLIVTSLEYTTDCVRVFWSIKVFFVDISISIDGEIVQVLGCVRGCIVQLLNFNPM